MAKRTIQYTPSNTDGIAEQPAIIAGVPASDGNEPIGDTDKPSGTNGIDEFDPSSGVTTISGPDSGTGSGTGSATGSGTDGGTGSGLNADGSTRRKRGRQPGTQNKPKDTTKHYSQSLKGLESMLFGVHSMLAMITKTPELMFTETECQLLSKSAMDVAQFYPIGASEKTMAWANLFMVAGGLYGTRAVVLIKNYKETTKKKPTPFRVMETPIASKGPVLAPKSEPKQEAKQTQESPMEPPALHFHQAPTESEVV